MKAKVLGVSVVGALAWGSVQAATLTLYGEAQVEMASVDESESQTEVADNARGRIGVEAQEDLGGGLFGLAKFEFEVDTADNAVEEDGEEEEALDGREAFIGLQGGLGTLMLGNLRSPYKYSGGVNYDPFNATYLESRGNGGMSAGAFGHEDFISNAVSYMTPNLGGVQFWLLYSPDERGDGQGSERDFAVSLLYQQAHFEMFVATVHDDAVLDDEDRDYDALKFGGRYHQGGHSLALQYELIEDSGAAGEESIDKDIWFLGYHYSNNKLTYALQFGQTKEDDVDDLNYWALGLIYRYSKTFRGFLGYRASDRDEDDASAFTLGARMAFSS